MLCLVIKFTYCFLFILLCFFYIFAFSCFFTFFFFQAEDGIRDHCVTGVQTYALPISHFHRQELRAQTFSDDENKERRRDECRRNDVIKRQTIEWIGAIEEHERADQEGNDSADRKSVV